MTAAVLTAFGGPEVLQVRRDVPIPTLQPGQVLVQVTAASVNNTDIWTREGAYGFPGKPDAKAGLSGPRLISLAFKGATSLVIFAP